MIGLYGNEAGYSIGRWSGKFFCSLDAPYRGSSTFIAAGDFDKRRYYGPCGHQRGSEEATFSLIMDEGISWGSSTLLNREVTPMSVRSLLQTSRLLRTRGDIDLFVGKDSGRSQISKACRATGWAHSSKIANCRYRAISPFSRRQAISTEIPTWISRLRISAAIH